MANNITTDEIREGFSQAISTMYQDEEPVFTTLQELVDDVNLAVLENDQHLHQQLVNADALARLKVERHATVWVRNGDELATLRRIFAVMGMSPVGYYDLCAGGEPAHATLFRPVEAAALAHNPLRVCVCLAFPAAIGDEKLRKRVSGLLRQRDAFTLRCRQLLDIYDERGAFNGALAEEFIHEVLTVFRWRPQATADDTALRALADAYPRLAAAACFPGCYLQRLALRTLDIDRLQAQLEKYGLCPPTIIAGAPRREQLLLLRQVSFAAQFAGKLRDGGVEQRGMALTPKGAALYTTLLAQVAHSKDNLAHQLRLQAAFADFPDTEVLLRRQGLAYFCYRLTPQGESHRAMIRRGDDPQALIERGWLSAQPVIYEDLLPPDASAATDEARAAFEQALGCLVLDPYALYQQEEDRSKRRCGLL
ncbi:2-oxoadipate dioxygenase/decarboxylase family protein [Entomohabitans teleogrylli]|uniref:2-oxoadipate dioxygenase/decarboxylase family protein n=1 Tax=Entomohabitans teleogrylli TaxID=1384589 RepID=UPI00073D91B7|nr:DUF1338 family protein [Entomohabitans teleogrylli]